MPLNPKLRYALLATALAGTAGSVYWASRLPQGDVDASLVAQAEAPRVRQRDSASKPGETRAPAGELDLQRLKRGPSSDPRADLFGPKDFRPRPAPGSKPIAQQAAAVEATKLLGLKLEGSVG